MGREILGDLTAGLRREWLVTNGLGGYASGTIAGVNTRRYHGLFIASLAPPVARTVLVAGLVEWLTYDSTRYPLSTHEFAEGTISPDGFRYLEAFRLDGMLPVWIHALADALLEKSIWMVHGENTSCVRYRLLRAARPADLELTPLLTYRDVHSLRAGGGWRPDIDAGGDWCRVRPADGTRYTLRLPGAQFTSGGEWWWNFYHREEASRGLDARSDLFTPGTFRIRLSPGDSATFTAAAGDDVNRSHPLSLADAQRRQEQLIGAAQAESEAPIVRHLVLAADQFIAQRSDGGRPAGTTIIAGYHWFSDWGRDTMIALPGLTLATGRSADAADILRSYAPYVVDGLLPNNFPDGSTGHPGYNTADASLWFVMAVRAYAQATRDASLVDDLLPALRGILDTYREGTRYNIGVDRRDGLLRAGAPGVQLTWMDAKIGDWVVTPRIGKAVELNALYFNGLLAVAEFLAERGDGASELHRREADRMAQAFRARFWREDLGYLADVIDGPDGDDVSLRPNQIFAVSLPYPLVDRDLARRVVDAVGRRLLTTCGLRSLDPGHASYRGTYGGDQARRDAAYHQGTTWPWLLGQYAEAYAAVHGAAAAHRLLQPFVHHLSDAGLGTISEIFDGDPPHLPRGCIAQAWSVAELLRVLRRLSASGASAPAS